MPSPPPSLLVVEDDASLRQIYREYLGGEGFRVSLAGSAAELRSLLERDAFDLMILDLGLPGEDGLGLVREIRLSSDMPIILVSGSNQPDERVAGLEAGADDFIGKPFFNRELAARIRNILRRLGWSQETTTAPSGIRTFQGWSLDIPGRRLKAPTGSLVRLTSAEFQVLVELARAMPDAVTRNQLLAVVHGRSWTPEDRSIDIHISNLRRKIEFDSREPQIIVSVRNIGYALAP